MASQREWESVVWHFLADHLRSTSKERIKDWIYGLEPEGSRYSMGKFLGGTYGT